MLRCSMPNLEATIFVVQATMERDKCTTCNLLFLTPSLSVSRMDRPVPLTAPVGSGALTKPCFQVLNDHLLFPFLVRLPAQKIYPYFVVTCWRRRTCDRRNHNQHPMSCKSLSFLLFNFRFIFNTVSISFRFRYLFLPSYVLFSFQFFSLLFLTIAGF